MTMGTVKDDQAAGRVFCNYTQGLEYMVWTQNDGHLMGYVAGAGARGRVELVGGDPPQHRHRRLPMNMNMTPSASPSMSSVPRP